MSRYVDLAPAGPPVGRCVVLPGRQYTADGPLLFFATQIALDQGWAVRQVWWDPPERGSGTDEVAWVAAELDAALAGLPGPSGPLVVVAKSLGTLAAARAAALGLPVAWLTPLLADPALAAPLRTYPAPQLVAIGTEDPFLDRAVYDALPGTRVLVAGDHVLRVPGDVAGMVAAHERVARAFEGWLGAVGADPGEATGPISS